MDKKHIDIVKNHLEDINKTITALDPAIRAAAFDILAPLYFKEYEQVKGNGATENQKVPTVPKIGTYTPDSIETFFASHQHTKPADNVTLIAA